MAKGRGSLYGKVAAPVLFRWREEDPEEAHNLALRSLARLDRSARLSGLAGRVTGSGGDLPSDLFGLTFPNPVGMAAGFDKQGEALHALAALGFGFIEMGTITRHAQEGNPRPRIARHPELAALRNWMGFNNAGAEAAAARLEERFDQRGRLPVPLGISIGKSRVTPVEEAVEDYLFSLGLLAPYADYIAANVSSPNTPGLRSLQDRAQIDALLAALQGKLAELERRPPLLVKVAPDLTDSALDELLDVCLARDVAGVIAVNTTIARTGVAADLPEQGGLSGRPLHRRALSVVAQIHQRTQGRLPVIGVGGIFTGKDAYRMLRAGASLVQVYTGFVYRGPRTARYINHELRALLARDGIDRIEQIVGVDAARRAATGTEAGRSG